MTVVKAAAVQISPVLYSCEGTVEKVVKKIADLGRQGAQFATFPETAVGEPLRSGEGEVIADLDFSLIDSRKAKMDSRGHYSRPELLSLLVDYTPSADIHERDAHHVVADVQEVDHARF